MPGTLDLDVYRGDSAHWQLAVWTDVEETEEYDLTDAVAEAQIRVRPGSDLLAQMECVVTPPNVIDVDLSAASSAGLTRSGWWDLQLTFPDGAVRTLLAGRVTVTADVTLSPLA
jgi:hypothetical protein